MMDEATKKQRLKELDAVAVRFHERIMTFIKNYHLEDILIYTYSCMDMMESPRNMDRHTRFWLKVNGRVVYRKYLLRDMMDFYGMTCKGFGPFGSILLCAEAGGGYKINDDSIDISNFRTRDMLKRRIMSMNLTSAIKKTAKNINTSEWLRGGNQASGPIPEDMTREICRFLKSN